MRSTHVLTTSCLVAVIVTLSGCSEAVPDYTPFATGLRALGICLVCCAAVKALAELIKGQLPPSQPPPPSSPNSNNSPKE